MTAGRRVLITGISGGLAGLLAARLEDDDGVEAIAGVDIIEPTHDLRRTEFIRADLSSHTLARALDRLAIDTLVHLDITAEPGRAGGRSRMKEKNVIRTMQLLGAAGKAKQLRRVIMKSTTAVYGSSYADPSLLREDAEPDPRASGYARDAIEVETYARGFARRRSDVAVTILRFANFIGGGVDSVIGTYLELPVVPTVLGYDPRIQLCHVTDAVEVLAQGVTGDHPGTYNVAGTGVVYLSQMVRLAGKVTVPVPPPLVGSTADLMRRLGLVDFSPEQVQFLLYGRVGDLARLQQVFGYQPRYRTRTAVEEYLRERPVASWVDGQHLQQLETRILAILGRSHSAGRST